MIFKNQEDGDEDDLLSGADPLNEVFFSLNLTHTKSPQIISYINDVLNSAWQINLANYLADFLVKFSHSDRQLFDHLCQVGF